MAELERDVWDFCINLLSIGLLVLCAQGCGLAQGKQDATLDARGFTAEQVAAIGAAASEWNERAGTALTVVCGAGDVSIRPMPDDGAHVGWTTGSDIELLLAEPESLRKAALHELGHYLTGGRHSDNPDDVMFRMVLVGHLSSADVARIGSSTWE